MTAFCRFFLLALFLFLAACGDEDDPTRNNDFVPLIAITITSEFAEVPAEVDNRFTATGDFGVFTRDLTGEVTWSSSDPAILVFDDPANGRARAVAPGTVTVTAARNGVTGTLDFTVNTATLDSITVLPDPAAGASVQVPKGQTQQFTVQGNFSDGTSFPLTRNLQWVSADPLLVSVNASGLATGVGVTVAPVEITATFTAGGGGTFPDSVQVSVTAPVVESIQVTPANALLTPTETQQFTAAAILSDGTPQAIVNPTWSSSNTGTATVAATGLVTAVANGTTTISARDPASGLTGSTTLTVATVTSISVTPQNASVSVGAEVPLTATATLSNGSTRDITTVATWTSNRQEIAVVGNDTANKGRVTGIAAGTATITATRTVNATTTVTVTAP